MFEKSEEKYSAIGAYGSEQWLAQSGGETLTHELSVDFCLEARDLGCIRDDRQLFNNLNFSLHPQQALLIEGRNGSGKSTLLRILCGIRDPDKGDVYWSSESINKLGSTYRAQLLYVGHHDGNKLDLTATENLNIARALDKASDMDVEEALERVGLYGYEDVLARNMSAGQRRRLALARLLVVDCKLWILDEPFTALDRESREVFVEQLENHVNQGGMIILAAHHDFDLENAIVKRINLSS